MGDKSINNTSYDRKKIIDLVKKTFDDNGITYKISKSSENDFINYKNGMFGSDTICLGSPSIKNTEAVKLLNSAFKGTNAKASEDNYNTVFVTVSEAVNEKPIYDSSSLTINSTDDIEFDLPGMDYFKPDVKTLLDQTPLDHIYLTSDWHLFKNHYKREPNHVNTQKIISWCRENINQDDVFMYLGDISFRYANEQDKEKSQKIMASIPGYKILILGNHDKMLGQEYFTGCGFDYVMEDLEWQKYVFTHRPINMNTFSEDMINIHGHIHNIRKYNTTDGKRNINAYPMFYDNKPVTLKYIINHVNELTKDNEWNPNAGYGEQSIYASIARGSCKPNLDSKMLLEALLSPRKQKPTVFYSPIVDSKTIAYMVSIFKDRLGTRTAIKLHFGEDGNKNFLNPKLLKDLVRVTNGALVDSNTAYDGSTRKETNGHIATAQKHGFDFAYIDILDADGYINIGIPRTHQIESELQELQYGNKKPYQSLITQGRHLKEVAVGSHLKNYDSMIVYTHFKGHSMAGYGGALKNIGMGIPSGKVGKIQVHGKEFNRGPLFLERLVESASAIQQLFNGRIVYVNILQNMSTECDCDKDAPKATIPDIGVLVSDDLLAIEQASIDFIRNAPKNKDLIEQISFRGGLHQLEYMEWLDMGSRQYILKDLSNKTLKLESTVLETKRSELPDSAFGIPEDRKFPLDTEQHVRSAIKLFGHAEESKKRSLAKRIRSAAKRYDISIPENTQCYKYLTESTGITSIIPEGIDTIIFDFGGVLVNGDMISALENHPDVPSEYAEDINDFINNYFFYYLDDKTKRKVQMMDVTTAKKYYTDNAPEHIKSYVDSVFECFETQMFAYDYFYELLDFLKSKGYKIYYLSNWDKYSYDMETNFFKDILIKFNGGVFSFEVNLMKPDREIYDAICKQYNIDPKKAIFFDDRQENVDAAIAYGMDAVVWDVNVTPKAIIGSTIDIPPDVNNSLVVRTQDSINTININDITWWYVSLERNPNNINRESYYSTIEEAIESCVNSESFNNDNSVEAYVFTSDIALQNDLDTEQPKLIIVGKIIIHDNLSYEWLIQYPLRIENHTLINMNEWAAASVNPVIGITKPFILKVSNNDDNLLNKKQYVLSPDIVADKYLVIDEDNKLVVRESCNYKVYEVYEYCGPIAYVNRLASMYSENIECDSIYTALTNKRLLTEDQIDFDPYFKKVDIDFLEQKALSEFATLRDSIIDALGFTNYYRPVLESSIIKTPKFVSKYNTLGDIVVMEDYDGYYFYSNLTKKRSASVGSSRLLTENMIKTIL